VTDPLLGDFSFVLRVNIIRRIFDIRLFKPSPQPLLPVITVGSDSVNWAEGGVILFWKRNHVTAVVPLPEANNLRGMTVVVFFMLSDLRVTGKREIIRFIQERVKGKWAGRIHISPTGSGTIYGWR
jgi:hypothetical protein